MKILSLLCLCIDVLSLALSCSSAKETISTRNEQLYTTEGLSSSNKPKVVNNIDNALTFMGMTRSNVNWELAFAILAERFANLNKDYERVIEQNTKILAIIAPAYVRKYIEQTKAKFLSRSIFDVNTNEYSSMVKALGLKQEDVDRKIRALIKRAEEDKGYDVKDSFLVKTSLQYVSWKYILTKLEHNDKDVEQLKNLLKEFNMDEDTFALEMAYLWVRCSAFGIHDISETGSITLNTLLDGLRFYKMSYLSSRVAVTLLYKLFTN